MTLHTPLKRRPTRRWLKAVTLMLGVVMGLMLAMTSASALESASEGHSCCCDPSPHGASKHDASAKEGCEHHSVESSQPSQSRACTMATPSDHCQCHLDSDDNAPAGDPLALTASSFSFAPALAARLHPQLDIPLARAPSAVSSDWLDGQSPPEHLYLLHQTFLN